MTYCLYIINSKNTEESATEKEKGNKKITAERYLFAQPETSEVSNEELKPYRT